MGARILNKTNPMVVNGENTETKHRPIDGSYELMDAIFPIPKKEPKLNNNCKIHLVKFKTQVSLIDISFTHKKKCMPPLNPQGFT